ncbi:MAG: hypothetical protein JWN44_5792, partial [Myxococcales bacterium]|nr:hypothetical protein [Myxococcales bacterium]
NGASQSGAAGTGLGGGGGGSGSYGRVTIRSRVPPTMVPGVVPAIAYAPSMLP